MTETIAQKQAPTAADLRAGLTMLSNAERAAVIIDKFHAQRIPEPCGWCGRPVVRTYDFARQQAAILEARRGGPFVLPVVWPGCCRFVGELKGEWQRHTCPAPEHNPVAGPAMLPVPGRKRLGRRPVPIANPATLSIIERLAEAGDAAAISRLEMHYGLDDRRLWLSDGAGRDDSEVTEWGGLPL